MKQKKVSTVAGSDYPWEAERIRDNKLVKGIFRFHEVPGGTLSFSFRKYKGDPVDDYTLIDGQMYEVPLRIAVHLKESGWYPVHKHAVDEKGNQIKVIGQKVKRYTFEPLDFIADERLQRVDADKSIVTINHL